MLDSHTSVDSSSPPPPYPWPTAAAQQEVVADDEYELAYGVDDLDDVAGEPEAIAASPRWWRYAIPVVAVTCLAAALLYFGGSQATADATAAMSAPAPLAAPVVVEAPKPAIVEPAPLPAAVPVPAAVPAAVKHIDRPPAADPTAPAPAAAAAPAKPSSADALVIQYQRVGHELASLEDRRGLNGCTDLRDSFRAIKISDALATSDSRAAAAATLSELHDRIVRRHGIEVSKECQNNPLAKDCL